MESTFSPVNSKSNRNNGDNFTNLLESSHLSFDQKLKHTQSDRPSFRELSSFASEMDLSSTLLESSMTQTSPMESPESQLNVSQSKPASKKLPRASTMNTSMPTPLLAEKEDPNSTSILLHSELNSKSPEEEQNEPWIQKQESLLRSGKKKLSGKYTKFFHMRFDEEAEGLLFPRSESPMPRRLLEPEANEPESQDIPSGKIDSIIDHRIHQGDATSLQIEQHVSEKLDSSDNKRGRESTVRSDTHHIHTKVLSYDEKAIHTSHQHHPHHHPQQQPDQMQSDDLDEYDDLSITQINSNENNKSPLKSRFYVENKPGFSQFSRQSKENFHDHPDLMSRSETKMLNSLSLENRQLIQNLLHEETPKKELSVSDRRKLIIAKMKDLRKCSAESHAKMDVSNLIKTEGKEFTSQEISCISNYTTI